jgi:hypothetical protein
MLDLAGSVVCDSDPVSVSVLELEAGEEALNLDKLSTKSNDAAFTVSRREAGTDLGR